MSTKQAVPELNPMERNMVIWALERDRQRRLDEWAVRKENDPEARISEVVAAIVELDSALAKIKGTE